MKLRLSLASVVAVCSFAAPLAAQSNQTLPAGFDTVQGGSGTSFPFNQLTAHKWQWHYANSNFAQSGPIRITEIYVRALSTAQTVTAFDFPNLTVTLAAATTGYTTTQHDPIFANNLAPGAQVVRSGPWTGGPVTTPAGATSATWIPLGITAPFDFDPTSGADFIVQLEKCASVATFGGSIDGRSGSAGFNGGNRYGDINSCSSVSSSFSNNEYVPIVRIDWIPATAQFGNYCTAATTTSSCAPTIASTGAASASHATPFQLTVSSVEGQRSGLLFYGINNTGFAPPPWGSGFLCVKPPLQRTGLKFSGGTLGACDGVLTLDWNAFHSSAIGQLGAPLSAGQMVYAQAWFQDPPNMKATATSNALFFTLAP